LLGVLAAGQQRRGPFDGRLFCLGRPRPGPQPGATEAVAYRGDGSDEAGGKIRVAAFQGQRRGGGIRMPAACLQEMPVAMTRYF
jgi:hypothetical protein